MNERTRGLPPTCHPDRKHFGNGLCKPCYQHEYVKTGKRRLWYVKNRERQLAKSRAHYYKNRAAKLAQSKQYRIDNPDKTKNRELRYRYGITLQEFNTMLETQKNLCKFCNEPLDDKQVVDHNHVTGEVRGIIHYRCNIIIGFFETHKKLYKNLIPYLNLKSLESECQ